MTDEGAKKKYVHLKWLIGRNMKTGNAVRDDLIVSDAERHLADLLKKRPKIDFDGSKARAIAKAMKEAEAKAMKEAEAKEKK